MQDGGMADLRVLRDGRRPEWFWVDNRIIDTFGPVLGPSALAVYIALVRRGNARGLTVMGISTIARDCGMGATAVRTAIEKLERLDLIEVYTRYGGGGQRLASEFVIPNPPMVVRADWATRERPAREASPDPSGWKERSPTGIRGGITAAPPESDGGQRPTGKRGGGPRNPKGAPPESEGLSRTTPLEKKLPVGEAGPNFELLFEDVERHLSSGREVTIELLVAMGVLDADTWLSCERHVAFRTWVRRSKLPASRFRLDRALAEAIDAG